MVPDVLRGFFEGETVQMVGFTLGEEEFAVPILAVREINQLPELTEIPQSPPHVAGITNLRGRVIPVVDTASHFGMASGERDAKQARMIVVEVSGRPVGFMVDAVTQVRRLGAEVLAPAPTASSAARAEFIAGIAKLESHLLILLDPAKMVGVDDLPPEEHDVGAEGSPVAAAA